ncbi:MAG: hypothetical protein M5U28_28485 [Sandaracinaceae bacterium]|nr:hypothetical protein [Sandaracinaceae bacterium]
MLVADERMGTLMDFRYKRRLVAPSGEHGRGKDQYGKGARISACGCPWARRCTTRARASCSRT